MVHDKDLEMAVFHTQMKPMPMYEVQIPLINKVPHIFLVKGIKTMSIPNTCQN